MKSIMIHENRIFKIIKYPGNKSGKYIIEKEQSEGLMETAEVAATLVTEELILVSKEIQDGNSSE